MAINDSDNSLTAKLRFLKVQSQFEQTSLQTIKSSEDLTSEKFEDVSVKISNGRSKKQGFSLDREGFILLNHKSRVNNLLSDEEVENVYTTELEILLRKITGCDRVIVFNHTRRSSEETNSTFNKPALTVHNDFTEKSMLNKFQEFANENKLGLGISDFKRISILIVWRSCKDVILSYPLCLCDISTTSKKQIHPIYRISDLGKNEVQLATHNIKNKWYYFPKMNVDEIIIFRSADSGINAKEIGVLHSAIRPESVEITQIPRISLESRCFVLYKK